MASLSPSFEVRTEFLFRELKTLELHHSMGRRSLLVERRAQLQALKGLLTGKAEQCRRS